MLVVNGMPSCKPSGLFDVSASVPRTSIESSIGVSLEREVGHAAEAAEALANDGPLLLLFRIVGGERLSDGFAVLDCLDCYSMARCTTIAQLHSLMLSARKSFTWSAICCGGAKESVRGVSVSLRPVPVYETRVSPQTSAHTVYTTHLADRGTEFDSPYLALFRSNRSFLVTCNPCPGRLEMCLGYEC